MTMATVKNTAQGVRSATGPSNQNSNQVELYPESNGERNGHIEVTVVNLNLSPKIGSKVQGYADIEVWIGDDAIVIFGLRIIVVGDKPPWVSFPSRKGTIAG